MIRFREFLTTYGKHPATSPAEYNGLHTVLASGWWAAVHANGAPRVPLPCPQISGNTMFVLLGDRYIQAPPAQALVPFGYKSYAPVWVGLGQIGLYGLALVGLSFYVKPLTGRRVWRAMHSLSFAVFLLALLHGIGSGSDSTSAWTQCL